MRDRLKLPPTVHHHAHFRLWQRKFHDMNIRSEKKRPEKLNYMPVNPVNRRPVQKPGAWPFSSWRFC